MLTRFRYWLIKKLAGTDQIGINLIVSPNGNNSFSKYLVIGPNSLYAGCLFANSTTKTADELLQYMKDHKDKSGKFTKVGEGFTKLADW